MDQPLVWLVLGLGLGPLIGSFLGLVSLRWPAGKGVILGRSACGACGRPLAAVDLIPIASFLITRGRCRRCGAKIPLRYPLLEAGCAVLAGWSALTFPGPVGFLGALLGWQLLLLAVLDAEHFWLPRRLTGGLIVTGLATAFWPEPSLAIAGPQAQIAGAAVGFAGLALIAWIYRRLRGREGLGGGDAYLLAGGGAWCGAFALPSILLIAAGGGLLWALGLRLAGRPLAADQPLPFGVFLAMGIWLTWLYGPLGL